ncbi:MAG: DUF4430 domain-containing protein [Lachnospiraceae bacterium]|nr:DUF4430 domain-containing protein [Lachnospiraceae bacterium]
MKSKETRSNLLMILTILIMIAAAIFTGNQISHSDSVENQYVSWSGNSSGKETDRAFSGEYSCTIRIDCTAILENMDSLKKGKENYIPEDGCILETTEAAFSDGETVFDILKRVCEETGIQLEYAYTPLYKSYYIEGMNQIYEFDCGAESGWTYSVNGKYPNYGCSSFAVKDGDAIVWTYTCDGRDGTGSGDVTK